MARRDVTFIIHLIARGAIVRIGARGRENNVAVKKAGTRRRTEIRIAFTRRALSIHPVSFLARYTDCINETILCIVFA